MGPLGYQNGANIYAKIHSELKWPREGLGTLQGPFWGAFFNDFGNILVPFGSSKLLPRTFAELRKKVIAKVIASTRTILNSRKILRLLPKIWTPRSPVRPSARESAVHTPAVAYVQAASTCATLWALVIIVAVSIA